LCTLRGAGMCHPRAVSIKAGVRGAIAAAVLLPGLGCGAEGRAPDAGTDADPVFDAIVEPSEAEDAAPAEPDDAACGEEACAPSEPAPATDQLEDGVVGSACDADAACGDGRCLFSERITGTPFPGGYCTGRCSDDAACGAQGYCSPGFRGAVGSCLRRCEDDADCGRDGYRCRVAGAIGRCMPGPKPLPDGVVGHACESDAECGGGPSSCAAALAGIDAPGGYCSQSCSVDADCALDGACVSGLGTAPLSIGTCFARCVPPDGCREGYTCNALSQVDDDGRGLCVPKRTSSGAGP
jgi:hypothetical protein